jgi:DNA-binding NtrC family response regulator
MRVLIVEHNEDLGRLWASFLDRQGLNVTLATCQKDAIAAMRFEEFDALVLELVLPDGGAIAISDYATYRFPEAPIITVTNSSFFSDGSIFDLIPNARGMMRTPLRPSDLAAMVEHYCPPAKGELRRKA